MKKELGVAILMLVAAITLTACTIDGEPIGNHVNSNNSQVISVAITDSNTSGIVSPINNGDAGDIEIAEGLQVIENRTVVNGRIQSYLTGEWKSVDVANRRPMAVMIPNNKAALPQY